jgi:arylsulfatase A-like enzyme
VKPNVILIACCSFRRDFLGANAPNLKRLAKEGVFYENCISPGTWTFPSHVSLFTGMYPHEHGVHEITNGEKVVYCRRANISLSVPRLAEQMEAKGYSTSCISNNFMISKATGFQYGFQNFVSQNSSPWFDSKLATEARNLGATPMQVLQELIKRGRVGEIPKLAKELIKIKRIAKATNYPVDKGETKTAELLRNFPLKPSFFLFIGLFDMHEPYPSFDDKDTQDAFTGIRPMNSNTLEKLKNEYREGLERMDSRIGSMLDTLKKRGLYDNSLIIITSDHGQAFNEHGFMYHGIYLYDEVIRVPLIVKYPHGRKFKKRKGYQSLVNIPALIESVVNGGSDAVLTSRKVFSEAYGNIDSVPESYSSKRDYINKKYEKARAAIYMDGYKLSVNGTEKRVEEFLEGSRAVRPDSKARAAKFRGLIRELKKFKAEEKEFKVPEAF